MKVYARLPRNLVTVYSSSTRTSKLTACKLQQQQQHHYQQQQQNQPPLYRVLYNLYAIEQTWQGVQLELIMISDPASMIHVYEYDRKRLAADKT